MNKLNKIGVSALCGSLAAISAANAGDLTVTGGIDLTYMSEDDATTGNPVGMGSNYTLKGSGELENGWTVDLSIANANGSAYSTTNVTIGLPGLGDVLVAHGTSGTGIQRYDDITPTVWEEADGAGLSAGINKIMGTSAGGTIEVTPTEALPAGLTAHIAWSKDADSGDTGDKTGGGTSGILGSGWDVTLEASSDLHGVDGLTVYGGLSEVNQYQNGSATSGNQEESVWGVKYAAGGFTVGYQQTDEETGNTSKTGYENTAFGISFSVNDDLSVSYGQVSSNQEGGSNDAEASSLQAAYTMGGATMRIAQVDVDNQTYGTTDYKSTILSLGLAF